GENSIVGQPYVEGAKIAGTVLLNSKNQKVLVYKQRCKKGYRKKQGHRQMFSRVMIDSIAFPGKENLPAEEVKAAKPAKTVKKAATKKAAPKAEAKAETKVEAKAEVKAEVKETTAAKKTTTAKKTTAAKKTSTTKKTTAKAETKTEE
ncbi:MAG: 50S ribosomal protein L21, partial [bacterium]|nr:50S ribosomal protein L21 [bacterium]